MFVLHYGSTVQYGPTPAHTHVPPNRAPAWSVVHAASVSCTASVAAVTVEPVAGWHEQHCWFCVPSVTASLSILQSVTPGFAFVALTAGIVSVKVMSVAVFDATVYVPT